MRELENNTVGYQFTPTPKQLMHLLDVNCRTMLFALIDDSNYFAKADETVEDYAIRMNFISNHDENSWSGDEYERMGDAVEMMTVFTYLIPGMPLIYTGQEYGNHHRLEFFEKDCIDRDEECEMRELYTELNSLRAENPALFSPEKGAKMLRLPADNDKIFAMVREQNVSNKNMLNTVIGIFNMSAERHEVTVNTNSYGDDYINLDGDYVDIGEELKLSLEPWEYVVLLDMD